MMIEETKELKFKSTFIYEDDKTLLIKTPYWSRTSTLMQICEVMDNLMGYVQSNNEIKVKELIYDDEQEEPGK